MTFDASAGSKDFDGETLTDAMNAAVNSIDVGSFQSWGISRAVLKRIARIAKPEMAVEEVGALEV